MRLAIDTIGTYGRGGEVILNALLSHASADERVHRITVFVSHPLNLFVHPKIDVRRVSTDSPASRLAWAIRGWQRELDTLGADAGLSFNGFGQARDQSIFIHNALYYDPARRRLSRAQRARLKVILGLTHRAAHRARSVIVQTQWMAEQVERSHGVKSIVAPTMPQLEQPSTRRILVDGPAPHLLFVGSELGYKDPHTFEECVALVGGTGHMIGNFEHVEPAPGCHWYGTLPRSNVFAAHRDADVLVMTSLAESFGLPMIEAMAQSLPIVAVDAPYAREICGGGATYFRPGDPVDAADKVTELRIDDPQRKRLQRERLEALRNAAAYDTILDTLLR